MDNCPPETRAQLEAREGIQAMEREAAMVRKKKCEIEAGDPPEFEEMELDYDGAAEFLQIQATERKKNRDKMNSGGPGAPGPVIANRSSPPRANHQKKKIRVRKVQADDVPDSAEENQIVQTDAPGSWIEIISMADRGDFDVTFRKDGAIILSTPPGATDCAEAPRPSKMPNEEAVEDAQ